MDQPAGFSEVDLGSLSARLVAKQAEVEAERDVMARLTEAVAGRSAERARDVGVLAVDQWTEIAGHDRIAVLLADVMRAQAKIAEGTVGSCDRCGEHIPAERLAAIAWTTRCVTCPAAY